MRVSRSSIGRLGLGCSLLILTSIVTSAHGQVVTWTNQGGAGNGQWGTATNWSPGLPVAGDDVVFAPAYNHACTAAAGTVPQNLASLTVLAGYTRAITFQANFAGGISQSLAVSGAITIGAGTLVLPGLVQVKSFLPAAVNTATEQITIAAHGFATGDLLQITNSGGGLPGGLSASQGYWARAIDGNTLSLHLAQADALAGSNPVDLTSAGTGTHSATGGLGVTLTAASFSVAAGATVHADGKGFAGRVGPASGESDASIAGGHGGRGGLSNKLPYGDPNAPLTFGSGGFNAAGGGAVKISAPAGVIKVDGVLRANGQDNTSGGTYATGAGGSLYLVAASLSGGGLLQARGGNAVDRASGGGGRIAVAASSYSFSGNFDLRGGTPQAGYQAGQPGTLVLPAGVNLTVGSGFKVGLPPGTTTLGQVSVSTGGELFFHGTKQEVLDSSGSGVVLRATAFAVQVGGLASADGDGYAPKKGPASFPSDATMGGGHGGRGGSNSALPYGSPNAPLTLGSGGYYDWGGGAVKIEVPGGSVTVDGTLRANGQDGRGGTYAPGAGGSIWVACNTLAGAATGLIQARGGNAVNRAGGGGGRVALSYTSSTFAGNYDCRGGTPAVNYPAGQTGTLVLPSGVNLTVNSGYKVGLPPGSTTLGLVSVASGAELFFHGTNQTAMDSSGSGALLSAASVTVQAGGLISADGDGYAPRKGPGSFPSDATMGGGHGGRGGSSSVVPYGSPTAPLTLGSGGYYEWGGGAIKIDCSAGTVTLDGTVRANSQDGTSGTYAPGAGGSIWIVCNTLAGAGSGLLQARGGNAVNRSGGGGGRISVSYSSSSFAGNYDCRGGTPALNYLVGQPGTLVLPVGVDLTINSGFKVGLPPGPTTLGVVTVAGGAELFFHGANQGVLDSSGYGAQLGCTAFAVLAGGVASADADGYAPRKGPGSTTTDATPGASHGGRGGSSTRPAYGSASVPQTLGSGGYYEWGGGAVKIDCPAGPVRVDGTIRANGQNGSGGTYAPGAGGSLWVVCDTLSGADSGLFQARGGNAVNRSGGGGGRIALWYKNSTFTGATSVAGGTGAAGYQAGEAGSVVPGSLLLANHPSGQATDQLTVPGTFSNLELFKFNLKTDGNVDDAAFEDIQVTRLVFDLSAVGGILPGEIGNVRLFLDSNNNGSSLDEAGPLPASGVTLSLAAISGTLSLDFPANAVVINGAANRRNFILRADIANVALGDKLTVRLNTSESRIVAAGTVLTRAVASFNGDTQNDVGFAELNGVLGAVTHEIPGNSAPRALDDSYAVLEDATLSIPAAGVLANDGDAEGDPMSAQLVSGPAQGTLVLNPDGSFFYDPAVNFVGTDQFTYRPRDGALSGNVATVTITVSTLDDPPVAAPDSYVLENDTPLAVPAPGLLANDSDVELDPLTAVLVSGPATGSLQLNPDGSFRYTPQAGFVGIVTFTYQAHDGIFGSLPATVTLRVYAPLEANPQAAPTVLVAGEVVVLSSLPSGGSGTYSTFQWSGPGGFGSNLQHPGKLTLPDPGIFSFTLTVTDSLGFKDSATISVAVLGSALAPNPFASPALVPLGGQTVLASSPSGGSGVYTAFLWSGPGGFSSAAQNPGAVAPPVMGLNRYELTVTDASGLTATASVEVIVGLPPSSVVLDRAGIRYRAASASSGAQPLDFFKGVVLGLELHPGDRIAFDFNGYGIGDWRHGQGLTLDERHRAFGQLGSGASLWNSVRIRYLPRKRKLAIVADHGSFGAQGQALVAQESGVSREVLVVVLVDQAPADGVMDMAALVPVHFKVKVAQDAQAGRVESGVARLSKR